MLEGDPKGISYNGLTDKPVLLQGEQGPICAQGPIGAQSSVGAQGPVDSVGAQGLVGAQGPVGVDGELPKAPTFVATPMYESNTVALLNYEVENLGDPEIRTAWQKIVSFH